MAASICWPTMPPVPTAEFIDVLGRTLHIRHVGDTSSLRPLVFLHEGLGSVDLWRHFPDDVVERSGHAGLVYSRYGNGWSTPLQEPRRPLYMHDEALEALPRVITMTGTESPILIGHSDGASMAIIYAGAGHPVLGMVLIAPHVFVEPETVDAIAAIREAFTESDLPAKMSRHHRDPRATFHGWADVWLSKEFRDWNIEEYLTGVSCPTLLIQGDDDEYGTSAQLDAIDVGLGAPAGRVIVPGAGHSPHLSHSELVTGAVVDFIGGLRP